MSRIHEALRKAARERSEPVGVAAQAAAVEIAREPERKPALKAVISPEKQRVILSTSGLDPLMSYDELVSRCAHPEWRIDPLGSIFHNPAVANGATERLRLLRSRLYQLASTRTLRKVLVTSGVASEGKTFVAANLAQSIVQQPECRVLLIDADLRAPRLHTIFGAPRTPGLTEYLGGQADEPEVIQKGADENLCLLCAGAEVDKPSELLFNERMKHLLETTAPLFDWIIIDSPPTLAVHDASDLARLTDGVLLVLRAGATNAEAAEKAAAEFKTKNLLGVVLNRVEPENAGEYYYSHQKDNRIIPTA